MSRADANKILDRVRDGKPVPDYLIRLALVATGDIIENKE